MIFYGDIFFFSLHLPSPPLSCHILSVEITHLFSAYSYNTVYKVEPPVGEEILTKFENRSALAQDLNLLSGDLHKSLFLFTMMKLPVEFYLTPPALTGQLCHHQFVSTTKDTI